jgi:hypothetical protein
LQLSTDRYLKLLFFRMQELLIFEGRICPRLYPYAQAIITLGSTTHKAYMYVHQDKNLEVKSAGVPPLTLMR